MVVDTWHCPKCGMELEATGVVVVDGVEHSVFQCDSCVVTKPIFDEPFQVALTFVIDENGHAFDPVDNKIL